jgi:glycine oxidase
MHHPDFCIAGAGIIGLSLALELHHRGATVLVLDKGTPLAEASTAAAGMLAADDPENPPQLRALADLSLSLYPSYLARIEALSGLPVPFQTSVTLQASSSYQAADVDLPPQLVVGDHHFRRLPEHSLDPRQLAASLLAAVGGTSIQLLSNTPVRQTRTTESSVQIETETTTFTAGNFIDCTGAWASTVSPVDVVPRKGQMLSLTLPADLALDEVVRTPEIYIVPRTLGPNAGRAIIGATVENRGFDKTIDPAQIAMLRTKASLLLPQLAEADLLETWAGFRPATPDGLPLLGPVAPGSRHFLATGHYRNGILLAPATARVLTQLLFREASDVDLAAFAPTRFTASGSSKPLVGPL